MSVCKKIQTFRSSRLAGQREHKYIIAQRFSYVLSKSCTKFRYNFALMRKSYYSQIMKKILIFAHFVISAISLFHAISLFRAILLNFEKQFRDKKYLFRMNAQFRANLVQKHETVAQENLLFCRNPNKWLTLHRHFFNFNVVNNSFWDA